jgi:hypothetical protein
MDLSVSCQDEENRRVMYDIRGLGTPGYRFGKKNVTSRAATKQPASEVHASLARPFQKKGC